MCKRRHILSQKSNGPSTEIARRTSWRGHDRGMHATTALSESAIRQKEKRATGSALVLCGEGCEERLGWRVHGYLVACCCKYHQVPLNTMVRAGDWSIFQLSVEQGVPYRNGRVAK